MRYESPRINTEMVYQWENLTKSPWRCRQVMMMLCLMIPLLSQLGWEVASTMIVPYMKPYVVLKVEVRSASVLLTTRDVCTVCMEKESYHIASPSILPYKLSEAPTTADLGTKCFFSTCSLEPPQT